MIPQTLVNMNLFVDGKSYAGIATEVNLPKLKRKTEEHRAGGMDGPVKIGMGMEMMDGSFALTGVSRDVMAFFGLADDTAFNGNFRGAYKNHKGEVVAVIATFKGMIEEIDSGAWKAGDKAETKFTIAPSYFKLEIDGQALYELDPANCIRVIDGKDEAAAEREAIGM
ncbi:phage major tail tube protein [Verminephrobacter aporrectodeae subsp. tuberculatae]|uniref:Phage major tail tube protein n=1 Tax=Verminephrobacter aporrectodeae subsp. tuberculatae TaxID=1110392 RepID=A0ABT3KMR0_9BURK|nr:phage major tail tube protein [Verminephrobacter aporrectodeae]MCW5319620.1 phage major tail tube protein [Verminephrobacter aporrectodeae subsp. tuberculatae]